jgi:hypothetical protein
METIIAFYSRSIPRTSVVDPDPHHFGNLDPDPDPDPHQIKIRIRIRIKVISWIRNRIRFRINLQMTRQNVGNMRLFEHFFKSLSLLFGSQDLNSDHGDADPQHCQELATGNYCTLD